MPVISSRADAHDAVRRGVRTWIHEGLKSSYRDAVLSGGLRALTMLATTGLTLFSWRLVAHWSTPATVGFLTVIATVPFLIPYTDLGLGVAIVNAVAEHRGDEQVRRTLLSAVRVMATTASIVLVAALALLLTNTWSIVLGSPPQTLRSAGVGATLFVVFWACAIPLGIGERLLLGSGRNYLNVLNMATAPVTSLVVLLLLHAAGFGVGVWVVAFGVGALVTGVVGVQLARAVTGLRLLGIVRDVPRPRKVPGARVVATAAPQLVVSIMSPLVLQTDRIMISHKGSVLALTTYAVAAWPYSACFGIVSLVGITLWPVLSAHRAAGTANWRRQERLMASMGVIALGLGLVIVFLGPLVSLFVIGTRPAELRATLVAFAALLLVQAVHMPNGFLQMDPAGLRWQAYSTTAMAIINLPLALALVRVLGPSGPVWSSVICYGLLIVVPLGWRARRLSLAQSALLSR